jgi:nucleoside phosphorylase
MPVSLLVVAAWEPELERFRALGNDVRNEQLNIEAVGIGLVDCAVGVTRSIARHAPTHVLLLGTCGAAPTAALAIGDVVVGSTVQLVDPATVEHRAALPYAAEPIALDVGLIDALEAGGARRSRIVNPLGITTDDALAATLAAHGDVEHLEAYGVARACALASVACAVVLGVANVVGARGREEWRANHVRASERAAEVASAGIRGWLAASS